MSEIPDLMDPRMHRRAQRILDRSDEHRKWLDEHYGYMPTTSRQIRSVLMAVAEVLGSEG